MRKISAALLLLTLFSGRSLALQADLPSRLPRGAAALQATERVVAGTRLRIVPVSGQRLRSRWKEYSGLVGRLSTSGPLRPDPLMSFAVLREGDGKPVALAVAVGSDRETLQLDCFAVDPEFQLSAVPVWLAYWTFEHAHRRGYQVARGIAPKASKQANGYYLKIGARLVERGESCNRYEIPLSRGIEQLGRLARLLG